MESVVAREDAQIHGKTGKALAQHLSQTVDTINVQVGKLQEPEAIEVGGQMRKTQAVVAHLEVQRIVESPLV